MIIKGIKSSGWPRLCTLGDAITKEVYRSLQGGGSADVPDILAAQLVASGVAVVDEGGE